MYNKYYADQCCELYFYFILFYFILLCSTIKHEDIIQEETKEYKI